MKKIVTILCIAMSLVLSISFSADAQKRHRTGKARTTATRTASRAAVPAVKADQFLGDWSCWAVKGDPDWAITLSINWYSEDKEGEDAGKLSVDLESSGRGSMLEDMVLVGKVENGVLKLQNSNGKSATCRLAGGKLHVTGLVGKSKIVFNKD